MKEKKCDFGQDDWMGENGREVGIVVYSKYHSKINEISMCV